MTGRRDSLEGNTDRSFGISLSAHLGIKAWRVNRVAALHLTGPALSVVVVVVFEFGPATSAGRWSVLYLAALAGRSAGVYAYVQFIRSGLLFGVWMLLYSVHSVPIAAGGPGQATRPRSRCEWCWTGGGIRYGLDAHSNTSYVDMESMYMGLDTGVPG